MTGRLRGRVAIITGAGSGIGRRAAERFAAEGAAVVCGDLSGSEEIAEVVHGQGGRALAVPTDVTSQAATEALAAAALEHFGSIDVLFANAGVAGNGSTAGCDPELWNRVIAVNLTGVWLSMRAVLPTMIAQRSGSIIATSSAAGLVGIRGIAPYSASKAGVIGLCRATAAEVGRHNVRVNALAPGTAVTPLVTATFSEMVGSDGQPASTERTDLALTREQERYPMRRFGQVDEIVSAALFLAGDDSSWVTGTVQVVDGGLTSV